MTLRLNTPRDLGGPAALGGPVDRGRAHPQEGGDGTGRGAADLEGEIADSPSVGVKRRSRGLAGNPRDSLAAPAFPLWSSPPPLLAGIAIRLLLNLVLWGYVMGSGLVLCIICRSRSG